MTSTDPHSGSPAPAGSAAVSAVPVAGPSALPVMPSSQTGGVPLWLAITTTIGSLVLGLSASWFVMGRSAPPPRSHVAPVTSVAKPPPTLLESAAQGEHRAMAQIAAIALPERSLAQTLALARGKSVEKHLALDYLRGKVSQPEGRHDLALLRRLLAFASDGDTATDALGVTAQLDGSEGPDLLYELTRAKGIPADVAQLAGQLLVHREVRGKASPALALLLDLRDAQSCEQRRDLLEKAIDAADKRLLPLVMGFISKTGCGDKHLEDCHPCLREANAKVLRGVLAKVPYRKAPTY